MGHMGQPCCGGGEGTKWDIGDGVLLRLSYFFSMLSTTLHLHGRVEKNGMLTFRLDRVTLQDLIHVLLEPSMGLHFQRLPTDIFSMNLSAAETNLLCMHPDISTPHDAIQNLDQYGNHNHAHLIQ